MEEIRAELILNWDKTGINIAPSSAWTLEQKGSNRVEKTGVKNKCQITAVFCGSHTGDFLPLQLVYKGKTSQCHPHLEFFSGLLTHQSTGLWSRPCCSTLTTLFCLACGRWVNDCTWVMKPAVAIIDNFKGQITEVVTSLLETNNIHVCLLPLNTTDLLPPMNIAVNKPPKDFLGKEFQQRYSEHVM